MGCCRGKPRRFDNRKQNSDCKRLEEGGARTVVLLVSTDHGLQAVVPTARSGFVSLGSFVAALGCEGPTARLIKRYVPLINQAITSHPEAFASYRSGIKITDLIRVAERATKGKADAQAKQRPAQTLPNRI